MLNIKLLASLGAIGVILLGIVSGFWYVSHLQTKVEELRAATAQAVLITQRDAEVLKQALDDAKRQGDILARQRDEAVQQAAQLQSRYQQLMETPHDQDASVSPVLCGSLVRLYEFTAPSGGTALSMQHPETAAQSSQVAKSACKAITQKDVAAWLETQVYPAFKLMQRNVSDLGEYVSGS